MKQLYIWTLIFLSFISINNARGHDFGQKNGDGVIIYYNYTNNGTELEVTYKGETAGNCYSDIVNIPETVTFLGTTRRVTSINDSAFYNCTGLTSVGIPNSVTTIGSDAFRFCYNIAKAEFASIESLCKIIFKNENSNPLCHANANHLYISGEEVTEVVIPNSVTTIGSSAFCGCTGLTSVGIPNSVTTIGTYAFCGCEGLTSINIPNSVTTIGSSAFRACKGLTSVSIPNSVTTIGNYAFSGCTGLTSIGIPNSVTTIGNYTFSGCKGLTSINIPNSVKTIGYDAFHQCTGLTKAEFASIESLCKINFRNEYSNPLYHANHLYINGEEVTEVIIPNSMTTIGSCAFCGCTGLTSVGIPNSVTTIGNSAFRACKGLTSVSIPNSVKTIGSSAFLGCTGLTSVSIPNSVKTIRYYTFLGCTGLTSVSIPNSVTSIEYRAFENCTNLTSVSIPNSVKTIDWATFYGCTGLTSINIPNSVTTIGYEAFDQCTGLTSVSIPNSVTTIGDRAFNGCDEIYQVFSFITNPFKIDSSVFSNVAKANATLYVPKGTKELYKALNGWKEFYIVEFDTTTDIDSYTTDNVTDTEYFSLKGEKLATPQPGINIVRKSDGTTKKVMVK